MFINAAKIREMRSRHVHTHTPHGPNVASLLPHCLQACLAAFRMLLLDYILIAFSKVQQARQVTVSQIEVTVHRASASNSSTLFPCCLVWPCQQNTL
jgi:uncharacterized protein (UPF0262 family)